MSSELYFRNRQRARKLNLRFFSKTIHTALREHLHCKNYDLGFCIVGETEMARVNWEFLRHEGSTDVITFDYSERRTRNERERHLSGEIFICIHDAISQAPRFRTTWQAELVRYAVHGLLHLLGYNDTTDVARRKMKREENRVMKKVSLDVNLQKIAATPQKSNVSR